MNEQERTFAFSALEICKEFLKKGGYKGDSSYRLTIAQLQQERHTDIEILSELIEHHSIITLATIIANEEPIAARWDDRITRFYLWWLAENELVSLRSSLVADRLKIEVLGEEAKNLQLTKITALLNFQVKLQRFSN